MSKVAMQTRCIFCKKEQYIPRVWSISHGEVGCAWCGKKSDKMTEEEYQKALREGE